MHSNRSSQKLQNEVYSVHCLPQSIQNWNIMCSHLGDGVLFSLIDSHRGHCITTRPLYNVLVLGGCCGGWSWLIFFNFIIKDQLAENKGGKLMHSKKDITPGWRMNYPKIIKLGLGWIRRSTIRGRLIIKLVIIICPGPTGGMMKRASTIRGINGSDAPGCLTLRTIKWITGPGRIIGWTPEV